MSVNNKNQNESVSNQLTVPGYYKNLARIGDFVYRAAIKAGLDERAGYALQMAVDEACANIIEHAYGGEGKGQIDLVYQLQEEGLQIIIYDQGRPFDPAQVTELDIKTPLNKRQLGGMGVFFMHRLVDRVEFEFGTPRGNQLRLFKRRTHP